MKRAPFRGLGAILFKEFITVLRDPMTLFFMFFPPLVEMIAFGYALDNDVRHMAMAVLNEDRTVESRQFLDRFVNTETFRIVGEVQNAEELAERNSQRSRLCWPANPPHFTRDLHRPSRPGANADRRLEFHHRSPGAQHRPERRLDAIHRDDDARERPAHRADRSAAANALQPHDAQPELFCPGRDRDRSANRNDLRHCHGRGARTGARHPRATAR